MTIDLKQAAALVLLGIAIGCAVSDFYFAGFIDDRAGDGLPISINGKLYEVQAVDRGTNLFIHQMTIPIYGYDNINGTEVRSVRTFVDSKTAETPEDLPEMS